MLLVLMLTTSVKASTHIKIKHRDLIMSGHISNNSSTISVYILRVRFIFLSGHVLAAVKKAKMFRCVPQGNLLVDFGFDGFVINSFGIEN
jgi:hypothetical protein